MKTVAEIIEDLQAMIAKDPSAANLPVVITTYNSSRDSILYSSLDYGSYAYNWDAGIHMIGIDYLTDDAIEQGYTQEDVLENRCVILWGE